MRTPAAAALAAALTPACASPAGPCETDGDCPGPGGVCVDDLQRGERACTRECETDADCPAERRCLDTYVAEDRPPRWLCLSRVRECGQERCNGLDDDCDGPIDEDCTAIGCESDDPCGAFVCGVAETGSGPARRCIAPAGPGEPGDACERGAECESNLCAFGGCATPCGSAECAHGPCVTAGLRDAPEIAACAPECGSNFSCDAGRLCRVAPAGEAGLAAHACLPPAGERREGEDCEAWDDCRSGMCAGGVCVRLCGPALCACDRRDVQVADDVVARDVPSCAK